MEGYVALRNEPLLSVDEVAEFLGVSRPTIYRLISSGDLRPVVVGARKRFFPEEIRQYLERHREAVPT